MRASRLHHGQGFWLGLVVLGCSGAGTPEGHGDGVEPVAEVAQALTDPGAPAPIATTFTDYGSVNDNTSYGTNFPKVEFFGRVYHRTNLGTGPSPIVFILHGNHQTCYSGTTAVAEWPCAQGRAPISNHLGYAYIAQSLASHGIIVVSISANGINASSAPGYTERAQLIQRHYDYMVAANRVGTVHLGSKFIGKIDFTRVAEVGHSKGGRAVLVHASTQRPPGLRAVIGIAPTLDELETPLINTPLAILDGYCDGDVDDLANVGYVDQARYGGADDEAPKHTFMAMGANHRYFNSYWTPTGTTHGGDLDAGSGDDWIRTADPHCGTGSTAKRLTGYGQRYVGRGYVAAFLRKYLLGQSGFDSLLKGDEALPQAFPNASVYTGYLPGVHERRELNRFNISNNLVTDFLGGAVRCDGIRCDQNPPLLRAAFCTGSACKPSGTRDTHFGRLTAGKLSWSARGGTFTQALPSSDYDISNFGVLQFRVAQLPNAPGSPPPAESPLNFTVSIRDRNNRLASVATSSHADELFYPPGSNGSGVATANKAVIMNTARFPLSAFAAADLKHASSVEFSVGTNQSATGNLLVSDMAFADPKVYGYRAGFAGNYTYGINTSTSHGACTFSSSGQVCTIPSSKTIHWCWEPNMSAASRSRISSFIPVLQAAPGVPTPLVANRDFGFEFVLHTNCNDTNVQLVIADWACSGTDSANMSGYVCVNLAGPSAANTLRVINTQQTPALGTYYSWGIANWGQLNIDLADIQRVNTSSGGNVPDRDRLLVHAVYHGLGWIIGLGARTDNDGLYTSRRVLPYGKVGWTAGEVCRAKSFRRTPDAQSFTVGTYCGPDPN